MVAPLIRSMLFTAAKKVAAHPMVRQKVVDIARTARPKAREAAVELDRIAAEVDPRKDPARFAGRVVGRLFRPPSSE